MHKHGAMGPCRTTLQRDPQEKYAPEPASCTSTVQSEPQQKYAAEFAACTNTVQSEPTCLQPLRKRDFLALRNGMNRYGADNAAEGIRHCDDLGLSLNVCNRFALVFVCFFDCVSSQQACRGGGSKVAFAAGVRIAEWARACRPDGTIL